MRIGKILGLTWDCVQFSGMKKVTEKPLFHHICRKIINPSSLAAQGVDCRVLTEKMQEQSLVSQGFAGF